jgi:7,8-dihydropterin-6-yl-methyl-4-(beta-D-ribofuranosyl)aminobenzene 5'-phosphate synthase
MVLAVALENMRNEMANQLAEVDRVEIQVIVDNVTDTLSTNPSDVRAELPQLVDEGLEQWSGESMCVAHHGLALLVTAHVGDERHSVLFDCGPEAQVFERNCRRLAVTLDSVDALVLSHGHWDHAGGLLRALELIDKPGLAVYLHPGMFRTRGMKLPDGRVVRFEDVPTLDEIAERKAECVTTEEAQLLPGGYFYVSGEIPRVTSYEGGFPNHVRRSASGVWEPDPLIMDERFLAVRVKDKGLVVFSACSHAGIINVLTHAQRTFEGIPLHTLVGGLHLAGPGPEKIIEKTVDNLVSLGLKRVAPGHCTGWRATKAMVDALGEDVVVPSAVGKRYSV